MIFLVSFLALIPLAKMLGFAAEELSLRVGSLPGTLLRIMMGNMVEFISGVRG